MKQQGRMTCGRCGRPSITCRYVQWAVEVRGRRTGWASGAVLACNNCLQANRLNKDYRYPPRKAHP